MHKIISAPKHAPQVAANDLVALDATPPDFSTLATKSPDGKTITIKPATITSSGTMAFVNSYVSELATMCGSTVTDVVFDIGYNLEFKGVTDKITLPGVTITIKTTSVKIYSDTTGDTAGTLAIDLSGTSATPTASDAPAGTNGADGQDGGSLIVSSVSQENIGTINFTSKGGDGSNGTNGSNGSDYATTYAKIDLPGGSQEGQVYISYQGSLLQGGDAGDGGRAGNGGSGGTLTQPSKDTPLVLTLVSTESGLKGTYGTAGTPGDSKMDCVKITLVMRAGSQTEDPFTVSKSDGDFATYLPSFKAAHPGVYLGPTGKTGSDGKAATKGRDPDSLDALM